MSLHPRNRLFGLALAVAGGIVLGSLTIKAASIVYENMLGSDPLVATVSLVCACLFLVLAYKYGRRTLAGMRRHWRLLSAIVLIIAAILAALAARESRKELMMGVADKAYADEYNRRLTRFLENHLGATESEFPTYELNTNGTYGYARIIKNMQGDHTWIDPSTHKVVAQIFARPENCKHPLTSDPSSATDLQTSALQGATDFAAQQDPVRYAMHLELMKMLGKSSAVGQGNEQQVQQQASAAYAATQKPDEYAKRLRYQDLTGVPPRLSQGNEQQVQQQADDDAEAYACMERNQVVSSVAKEYGLTEEAVRLNLREILRRSRSSAGYESAITDSQRDQYIKRLGDDTDPSPATERILYDQIVLPALARETREAPQVPAGYVSLQ